MSVEPPPPPAEPPSGWGDRYGPPPAPPDAVAYIRENGARYTREVLDQRLVAAGHTPDAIEAAWATVAAEDRAAGRADRRGQTAAIIGGAYVLTWLLVTVLAILPTGGGPYSPVPLLAGILAVSLFIPGIIAVAIARAAGWLRRAGIGRVIAFSVVPFLVLFALAGTCVSYTQSIG